MNDLEFSIGSIGGSDKGWIDGLGMYQQNGVAVEKPHPQAHNQVLVMSQSVRHDVLTAAPMT